MSKQEKLSFEEALAGLEKSALSLRSEQTGLEAAIKSFEEGIEYYNKCNEILTAAKQKIEVYAK